jgi:hypothetical protein
MTGPEILDRYLGDSAAALTGPDVIRYFTTIPKAARCEPKQEGVDRSDALIPTASLALKLEIRMPNRHVGALIEDLKIMACPTAGSFPRMA